MIQTTRTFHIEPTSRDISLATRKTACPIMAPMTIAVAAHRPRPRISPSGFPVSDVSASIEGYRSLLRCQGVHYDPRISPTLISLRVKIATPARTASESNEKSAACRSVVHLDRSDRLQ